MMDHVGHATDDMLQRRRHVLDITTNRVLIRSLGNPYRDTDILQDDEECKIEQYYAISVLPGVGSALNPVSLFQLQYPFWFSSEPL